MLFSLQFVAIVICQKGGQSEEARGEEKGQGGRSSQEEGRGGRCPRKEGKGEAGDRGSRGKSSTRVPSGGRSVGFLHCEAREPGALQGKSSLLPPGHGPQLRPQGPGLRVAVRAVLLQRRTGGSNRALLAGPTTDRASFCEVLTPRSHEVQRAVSGGHICHYRFLSLLELLHAVERLAGREDILLVTQIHILCGWLFFPPPTVGFCHL